MSKGIFITGTDTEVGKTYITAMIIKELRDNGFNATYFKGVLSGVIEENGEFIPEDAKFVCNKSNLYEPYKNIVSYTLKTPVSPHLACRLEDVNISLDKIKDDFLKLKNKYDYIVVEGSGGIVCPIKIEENEQILLEDIIKTLKLPVLIIARAGLGTINHTCLTINYLKSKGIKVKGIIINNYDNTNLVHKDNIKVIQKLTKVKIISKIPYIDEKNINIDGYINFEKIISLMEVL
ncbi:dethiobiotin synthase [Clostridium tarantellae]|uniref:ATP-dependent dethiobiotin synthetase BioD n=1 Tax=Clostridium tarantellae TaxID=39493 RepID=A0A6I1MJJ9_9CLOT|nr:dethiobiotin synthase [Clostridium tarantellae]MPQ42883.1 dethiobiotin synthase [Clostridium tarantellae]